MTTNNSTLLARVHYADKKGIEILTKSLANLIQFRDTVFVCIGSDRSTGDALGPLVGSKIASLASPNIHIYGTLDSPVHALNLPDIVAQIENDHDGSLIIAIDACLGRAESVGAVSLRQGPLCPGTGVNKTLPVIGDYHFIGVVNIGGFLEHLVLQNTRLSLVIRMADFIAESISKAVDMVDSEMTSFTQDISLI
ncbi:MAG: spore protease YyaC [Firmicutes bacterium]|nr:spore protease YyaC [Bacillota bacterium]